MAMLYESLAKACSRSGRFAIVATTDDKPKADRLAAETLLKRGVDGLILSTARDDDDFPDYHARHLSLSTLRRGASSGAARASRDG